MRGGVFNMDINLVEQMKTGKLNASNCLYVPGPIRDKFNLKKGETEFKIYVDVFNSIIAFKKMD